MNANQVWKRRALRSRQASARRLLTPQEASNLIGRSADYLRDQIRSGRLPATTIQAGKGSRFLIARADLELWIAERAQKHEAA